MNKDWIIEVLADLTAFAETNGMEATAAGLEDAALVAIAEIASLERGRDRARGPAASRKTGVVMAGTDELADLGPALGPDLRPELGPELGPDFANVTSIFAYRRRS